MTGTRPARKTRPPLDRAGLQELALAYVARFATSRGKLERYLVRKLRERGIDGSGDVAGLAADVCDRMRELGYVDDAAYAATRARTFAARGLGPRRLSADLAVAGVEETLRNEASDALDAQAAALRFAEKRRLGPFALAETDPDLRQKQTAAMLRAGHSFDVVRKILACRPGETPDFY